MADEEKETKRISRILSGFKSIGSRAASYPKDAARNVYYDYRAQSIMTDEQKKLSKQREEAYKAEEAAYKEKARREKEEEEVERRERDRRKQGGMGSGMMGGVAVQQAKSEDKGTWWLIFAIGIALLDIFWGDPYRGFKFTMLGILQTNFVAIFSSIIFLVLLLANVFFSIFKNRHRSIFTFIALYFAVNYIARFKIYSFEINTIYINIFIFMMVAIYLWRVFRREEPFNVVSDEDKGYILFIFVVSYFWFQNGWQLEIKSWIHFVFIIIFGMLFIKTHEPSPERWYYLTSFFLVLDFYGYSLSKDIEGLSLIFNLFPPILIFISLYVYVRTQNRLTIPIILFMTIVLFLANPTVLGDDSGQVLQKEKGKTAGEIYKEFKNSVLEVFDTRLVEASGGYYRGKVEKNQYEKLGVYLDNIRASEPRYYTDEPITIWGSLKSKTYGDVVIANFNCYRWTSGREKIKASRLEPAEPFPIFTLEEKDLECTFNPGIVTDEQQQKEQRFSAGTHTVTLAANYNFATDAYQKSYFIDRDRYRAMIRDELDPFEQYGITDKTPIAVYTNGPVAIGMQMTPLIPVEITNAARPLLGITLTNRGKIFDAKGGEILGEYEGRIKNITELVILLPEGITIEQPAIDCGDKVFKEYGQQDCLGSCTANIQNPCSSLCNSIYEPKPGQPYDVETLGAAQEEKLICLADCARSKRQCDSDCAQLFTGDGTEYNGYALEVQNQPQYRDELKDIDKFRTFGCRLSTKKDVLGSTPITTRFIRARARYNYQMEKSVQIMVEIPPIEGLGRGTLIERPRVPERDVPRLPTKLSTTDIGGVKAFFGVAGVTDNFIIKTRQVADNIGADYIALLSIMYFESARTFSPSEENIRSGATGLIQFMPDTAINLGTTTDALAQMTALEQLDWVEKYFDDIGGDYSDPTDLAIAVLWPAAIGKPDNHVLFTRQETPITYGQNRAVDTNNDGRITKGEYVSLALAKYYSYRHLA